MSFSLQDFLKVSEELEKKRSAEREAERVRDQETRAIERAADLEKIAAFVKDGVKDEVSEAIKPIVQQQKQFQEESTRRIETIEAQVSVILNRLDPPNTHQLNFSQAVQQPERIPPQTPSSEQDQTMAAISAAKKVIYLQPIYKKADVERRYRMHEGIVNDQQAMILAVKEFLKQEMKVTESDVPKIVKVFPPADKPIYDRLYVEFDTEHSADYIASSAKNIRKDEIHVGSYFPSMFQARVRALNHQARLIREAPGLNKGDVKTKIVYGISDIHILSRPRDGRWKKVQLNVESLPPIQLKASTPSSSPPAGRTRDEFPHKKRGPTSPLENDSKVQKGLTNDTEREGSSDAPVNFDDAITPTKVLTFHSLQDQKTNDNHQAKSLN